MRTMHIMGVQITSLLTAIFSADGILNDTFATMTFIISFISFAACSIYINKHTNELLEDIDNYYKKKESVE